MGYFKRLLCLMATTGIFLFGGVSAFAEETTDTPAADTEEAVITVGTIAEIKADDVSTDSVTLSWTDAENAQGYELYFFDEELQDWTVFSATETTYAEINDLESETEYTYKICGFCEINGEVVRGESAEITFTTLQEYTYDGTVTGFATEARSATSIRFKWNALSGADGYDLFIMNSSTGVFNYKGTTTSTVLSLKGLSSGKVYTVQIKPYKMHDGEKVYGNATETSSFTNTPRPTGLTVTSRTTSGYTLKWNTATGATGYDVLIYNNSKKAYDVYKSGVTSTSLKVTGLKDGAVAVYSVRPYIMFNGKKYVCSIASPVRAVTQVKAVKITSAEGFLGGAKLTWTQGTNGSGYRIYYSTSKNGTYKLLKTHYYKTSVTYKNTDLTGGKTYYFKIVPYKKSNNKFYDGVATITSCYVYKDNLNSILSSYTGSKSITVTNSGFKLSTSRKNAIMKLINNYAYSNTCGFVMLDIKSGAMVAYNADWYVPTASTVKAPYITYVLSQEIDKGNAKLADLLTYKSKHYNDGSGIIQYTAYGTKFSIKTVIHDIMYYSDNVGYLMLQDYFGVTNYNKWLKSLGCRTFINGTSTKWGYVSARDSAKIWVEIYRYIYEGKYADFFKKELLGTGYSPIRNNLGSKYKVANKFGGADIGWHDTGIVFKGDTPYILILLTNDSYLHADYYFQNSMIKQIDALHDELVAYNNSK